MKFAYIFLVVGLIFGIFSSLSFLDIEGDVEYGKASDILFIIICTLLITFSFFAIGLIMDIQFGQKTNDANDSYQHQG